MEIEESVYSVEISPAANDKMNEHFEFLARVSEAAAAKLLAKLMADMRSLNQMPYRNPIYVRPYIPVGKYRYMLSGDRYRIVYQIQDRTVFVEDVQDCRQSDKKSILPTGEY